MDVISYKCPNCAAPVGFNIETQQWDCGFCSSSFNIDTLEKSQPARESDPNAPPDFGQDSDIPFGDEAVAYSCPSCGGRIITDANTAATFCTYCHNPTVIASRLEGEFRPAQIIPFQLGREAAVAAMQKLCRRRPLLPKKFREVVKRGEVSGLYVPFWLFSCEVDADLRGEGSRISVWSDSRYRYTRTDTFYVERQATMGFYNLPADGSKRMDDRLMQSLEPFDYSMLTDFATGYLSGHFAESYDVDKNTASQAAFPRISQGVEAKMRSLVTGYSPFRTQSFNQNSRNNICRYALLPVWVVMADYNGVKYTFAMNGQTGKMTGRLPMSKIRLAVWMLSIFGSASLLFVLLGYIGGLLA